MKKVTTVLVLFLTVAFLLLSIQSLAATKVFEREYTYQASEADSKLSCRVIALELVKRLLLEEFRNSSPNTPGIHATLDYENKSLMKGY